ncbi:MAG: proline--tRNA ligase [Patescibacteria group bacterium]
MLQSHAFIHTRREAPKDEPSVNAQLLARGGYIDKLTSGVYTLLPLGLSVLSNIARIIREEMNAIGGVELLLPALHPKELWEETKRWDSVDDLYKLTDRQQREFALGATHEEVITDIIRKRSFSYKDMPFALYQIQTKFRDELRAKSGLLRGREFLMKDLYSFHADEEDRKKYYEKAKKAYGKIFKRCGLSVVVAEAGGGSFSKEISHEFQTPTEAGEDTVIWCTKCGFAQNTELAQARGGEKCPVCGNVLAEIKSIEVGNIFTLGTKFSSAMGAYFTDRSGSDTPMVMGCYGIGLGRVMGAVVETNHDDRGIIWPRELAPFAVHIVPLGGKEKKSSARVAKAAQVLYAECLKNGIGVLYDDRDASPGQKFADADLIGATWRMVVSEKTLAQKGCVEIKRRDNTKTKLVSIKNVGKLL